MKKFLALLIVLGITNFVNAGIVDIAISSLNGQPIAPTHEITMKPGDWVTFDVVYTPDPGWHLLSLFSMISIAPDSTGTGLFNATFPTWPPGYWDPDLSNVSINNGRIYIDATSAGFFTVQSGIVLDHLLFQCTGLGNVFIDIQESDESCPCDSDEIDPDYNMYFVNYGSGLLIHQVYEPACWLCPAQPQGDTNGDGKINALDYGMFKKAYGTTMAGSPHGTGLGQYNCCCDFNHDGKVNALDYGAFCLHYGTKGLTTCSSISCN